MTALAKPSHSEGQKSPGFWLKAGWHGDCVSPRAEGSTWAQILVDSSLVVSPVLMQGTELGVNTLQAHHVRLPSQSPPVPAMD